MPSNGRPLDEEEDVSLGTPDRYRLTFMIFSWDSAERERERCQREGKVSYGAGFPSNTIHRGFCFMAIP
jgi:hypothetical protein